MPRFSLRDLFWLVLVVGMALGWWVDRLGMSAQVQAALSEASSNEMGLAWLRSDREEIDKQLAELGFGIVQPYANDPVIYPLKTSDGEPTKVLDWVHRWAIRRGEYTP